LPAWNVGAASLARIGVWLWPRPMGWRRECAKEKTIPVAGGLMLSTHVAQRPELPRSAAIGVATGIFFMAFFGACWGLFSTAFLGGGMRIVVQLIIGLVTLGLFGAGGLVLWYARSLPTVLSPEDAAVRQQINRWFGIVFGLEFILIALASILLSRWQVSWFIAPVTALIVGVHFFPLARLFRVPVYYVTGALLAALALVAVAALLGDVPLAGPSPYHWSLFVGVGAMLILWFTALFIARLGLWMVRRQA
jgi:hypothetical protein